MRISGNFVHAINNYCHLYWITLFESDFRKYIRRRGILVKNIFGAERVKHLIDDTLS